MRNFATGVKEELGDDNVQVFGKPGNSDYRLMLFPGTKEELELKINSFQKKKFSYALLTLTDKDGEELHNEQVGPCGTRPARDTQTNESVFYICQDVLKRRKKQGLAVPPPAKLPTDEDDLLELP